MYLRSHFIRLATDGSARDTMGSAYIRQSVLSMLKVVGSPML